MTTVLIECVLSVPNNRVKQISRAFNEHRLSSLFAAAYSVSSYKLVKTNFMAFKFNEKALTTNETANLAIKKTISLAKKLSIFMANSPFEISTRYFMTDKVYLDISVPSRFIFADPVAGKYRVEHPRTNPKHLGGYSDQDYAAFMLSTLLPLLNQLKIDGTTDALMRHAGYPDATSQVQQLLLDLTL